METLNKIELCGTVGRSSVTPVGDTKVARFSLCTETVYNGKDGGCIIDCTWFSVSAWQGEKMPDLNRIQQGAKVHVIGRVRMQRYTDAEGHDRQCWEVVANSVDLLN